MQSLKPYNEDDGFDIPTYTEAPTSTKVASFFVGRIFVPVIMSVTPIAVVLLLTLLVLSAFHRSTEAGVRSFAASVLPITMGAFVIWIDRLHMRVNAARAKDKPRQLVDVAITGKAIAGFFGAVVWGLLAMSAVQAIATLGLVKQIPAAELVWSVTLSLLIYSHLIRGAMIWPWYLGIVVGFLLFLVFIGVPAGMPNINLPLINRFRLGV